MQRNVEIVTPASTYDLTTLATVKSELGIAEDDTSFDVRLARWISDASEGIAAALGRVLAAERVLETTWLDQCDQPLRGSGAIVLSRYPIIQVHSVTVDGTLLASSDYGFSTREGRLWRLTAGTRVPWAAAKVEVEFTGGFTLLTTLPRPIERALLTQVSHMKAAGSRDSTIRSESLDGVYTVSYWNGPLPGQSAGGPTALVPEAQGWLDAYVNHAAAIA